MIKIERYHTGLKACWDAFNGQAVNGTFFFDRTFMEYHGSRFTDHSLLFFRKNKLIALLPLHEENKVVASHQGLSFGGLIISEKIDIILMLQIFENLKKYLVGQGFTTLIYKPQPYIYTSKPGQDDLFALYQNNAFLSQRKLNSVLDITQPLHYSKLRQRCLKRAKEHNVIVKPSDDIENYMNLVQEVYHQAGLQFPTHSTPEIKYLMQAFPENISLFTAYDNEELIGGVLLFVHRQVINLQYIATSPAGKQKHALDLLVNAVINQYKSKVKYLNFGTSHDNRQMYQLSQSLVQNKSSYGARGVVQDTYQINFF